MGNQFVNLPAPDGNGAGAAVDVSSFGKLKTIVVSGQWGESINPFITIEVNNDAAQAGSWTAVWSTQGGASGVVLVAAKWMRQRVSNYRGGDAPQVDIGGTDDGTTLVNLPVTDGTGAGAAVDTSALPSFMTFQCGGTYQGAVNIEISEDGITDWALFASFQPATPGVRTASLNAKWMRVSRAGVPEIGAGLPVVNVGACADGTLPPLAELGNELGGLVPVAVDGITIVGNGKTSTPLVSLAGAGTSIYFNVKSYGATGNGSTDDTANCNTAEAAAFAVGGGTVYYPDGTYKVSERGTSLKCLTWQSGISILGQSQKGTIIKLADAQRESVRILWPQNATQISISNITLDGNAAGQSGPNTFHRDLIFLDNCSWVDVEFVQMQNGFASGIVVWQNTTDCTISKCYIHDNVWQGIALGDAGGQKRVHCEYTRILNNAGGFHIEASVNVDDVMILDCQMDAAIGNAALNIVGGGGGTDATKCITNIRVIGGKVIGAVLVTSAIDVLLEGVTVVCSDTAPTPQPAVKVSGQCQDVTIDNCEITLTAVGTAGQAVWFAGNGNQNTKNIKLTNSKVYVQSATADGVTLQDISRAVVKDCEIFGQSAAGFYGVDLHAKNLASGNLFVRDNHIEGFQYGIYAQADNVAYTTASVEIAGNDFASITNACMSLNPTSGGPLGRNTIQQADVWGNTEVGGLTMFATYPNVPMLIGGNRNGIGIYSVLGAPAFIAPIGSQALRRDPDVAGHTGYLNFDGTAAGWHAVNVT